MAAKTAEEARRSHDRRRKDLKTERSTWDTHWRDLCDHIQPRNGRFFASDRNKGTKKNHFIINSTASRGLRTLQAGLMAGLTSPSRPWFGLTIPNPDLAELASVRQWLEESADRMRVVLAKSNVYNSLHANYGDLGLIGTGVLFFEEDVKDVIRAYVIPVGQYMLANSARGEADVLIREFSMTVGQLVEKFGKDACSKKVQELFQGGKVDQWIEVVHVVEPNDEYVDGALGAKGKRWSSCWWEAATDASQGFLRESGYDYKPFTASRWDVVGEDIYGRSPCMDCLGDTRALQTLERKKGQVVAKIVDPPMRGPSSLRLQKQSLLPGETTYVDVNQGGQTFEPAVVMPPQAIAAIGEAINEHQNRIDATLYADLWLSLLDSDRRQITATEVNERHNEKMMQLGPVLERLNGELLAPVIEILYFIMLGRHLLPKPPPELQGQEIEPEFISILALAQKALHSVATKDFMAFVGSLVAVKEDVVDKVDFDKTVEEMADVLGVKSDLVVPQDKVDQIRAQRAQQQRAQVQAQAAAQAAEGARTLSQTDTQGDNALTRLMGTFGPAASSGVLPPGASQ